MVDILTYLLRNCLILCLQDTHLTPSDINSLTSQFPEYKILINGVKTNSRGVAIILKNNFEFKIKHSENDKNGNLILLDLQMGEISLRLIDVYAPNIDTPLFFSRIQEYFRNSTETYNLLCGDLNLVLDPKMDAFNYANINNPKSRSVLLEAMNSLNLCDIYRDVNPDKKRYTWRRKNPVKQARLDYAIGTSSLLDIINSCRIMPGYRSDHSRLDIELRMDSFIKGKGIWRFNCGLLKNVEYINNVKKWVNEVKQ